MELIKRIIAGDQEALKTLYLELGTKVYNTSLSYVQNESEAEEITQDVFLEVFHSAKTFRNECTVSTWVYRITVRKSLDVLKYKTRAKRFGNVVSLIGLDEKETEIPDFEHPGVLYENKEDAKRLFSAVYLLPEKQKTAFILSYIEELPQKEVAEVMHLNLKAVESLLQRAKKNLKEKIKIIYPDRRILK